MKEIKFRGLDKRGHWHYGYFRVEPDETHIIRERVAETHFADYEVIPQTVAQYTGQKDEDGVEIYEDDIFNAKVIGNIHENPELVEEDSI